MSTGDFKCPSCGSFFCNGYCRDRYYQPHYYFYPPIIPITPSFVNKESWQCFGCKRFYAPHIDHCECQITKTQWTSTTPEIFDKPQ